MRLVFRVRDIRHRLEFLTFSDQPNPSNDESIMLPIRNLGVFLPPPTFDSAVSRDMIVVPAM